MLSKEELKEKNSAFWNDFRSEMNKVSSVAGRQVNWINYPTDVKDIYVRMEVDAKGARLCFDIQPKSDDIRSILWEQMTELKAVMTTEMGIEANWNEESHFWNERLISRIKWENNDLNYFNEEDVPKIIDFLKDKLIRFDKFYQEYKDILVNLAN
ncbi:MAG: DUF4268 domain-containing protein [Fluviicola sp.]|nr:DUF4268 domain-containing protein [Fluviicola sp.]